MRIGDVLHFKSVDHKFCCSEHFLPTNFKVGLTGHRRQINSSLFSRDFGTETAEFLSKMVI